MQPPDSLSLTRNLFLSLGCRRTIPYGAHAVGPGHDVPEDDSTGGQAPPACLARQSRLPEARDSIDLQAAAHCFCSVQPLLSTY